MYLTIPHHFLGKLINGLDHPVRLQMWDTHSMRALFSLLIQRGRRVKCYEKPDTKWNRAMHSQGCADTSVTVSWDFMTLHWDLPWGEEVQKANMATSDERAGCWLLSATLCERKAVFPLIPGMHSYFHTTAETLFQSTQAHYFSYRSSKTSTTVIQKCNKDHSFQCSTFSVIFFSSSAPSILLFSVSLFLQMFSFLITLKVKAATYYSNYFLKLINTMKPHD